MCIRDRYSCYQAADGSIVAVMHSLDFTALRRRATNQVDVGFLKRLQEGHPGSFLLGGLNCTHLEKAFDHQVSLSDIQHHFPDFSRAHLGFAIDKLRKDAALPDDVATPTVLILSEGCTLDEWHQAINRHLDTYQRAKTRDKDTEYVLLTHTVSLARPKLSAACFTLSFMLSLIHI